MKKFSAENEKIKIEVKQPGAELCSLLNKKTGIEHIWQANPDIWGSHAPNLFPIIGMFKNGTYTHKGQEYAMPKHGFVRHNPNLELIERTGTSLLFQLSYSEETLKLYPFRFDFRLKFQLDGDRVLVSHFVNNLDNETMYFFLGGHPAFNICLHEGENLEDYSVVFDQSMQLDSLLLNTEGLITNEKHEVLKNDSEIVIKENTFDNDALIFENIQSKKASIKSRKHGRILSVSYKDFTNLGIWAKPGASYVCIEPWLGMADGVDSPKELSEKKGIISLEPGNEFSASYEIEIH